MKDNFMITDKLKIGIFYKNKNTEDSYAMVLKYIDYQFLGMDFTRSYFIYLNRVGNHFKSGIGILTDFQEDPKYDYGIIDLNGYQEVDLLKLSSKHRHEFIKSVLK
jgi:hypothetical protein